jgi:predicted O-linked N-acetylglucosamine transferase (SPINDLY family)
VNLHLPELIHESIESYEIQAIEYASNPIKLNELKSKLAANRLTAPLFDTRRFTKNLERAFVAVHQRHTGKLSPEDIC